MNFFEINTNSDIELLMNEFGWFHDSCIKEMVYISGGYVEENGAMYPFDSVKCVIIVFQSQDAKYRTIEVKFEGVEQMNLVPKQDDYDNIIYEASLIKTMDSFIGRNGVILKSMILTIHQALGFHLKKLVGVP